MIINRQSIATFLIQELEKQRRSLFLWVPVFVGAGIVTYFEMDAQLPWLVLVPALVFGLFAALKAYWGYKRTGMHEWLTLFLCAMAVGLFSTGYGLMKWRTDALQTPMIERDLPPMMIEGTIERLVHLEGKKAKRVILNAVTLESKLVSPRKRGSVSHEEKGLRLRGDNKQNQYRVRLKTYHFKGDEWQVGDRVSIKAKLIKPSPPVMSGGFDFSRKAYYGGLSAVGFTLTDATLIRRDNGSNDHFLEHIRSIIGAKAYHTMSPDYAGIAQALLTGERAGINDEDADALRASGLAHLLAISGLHIGLVAGCVFYFVRLFLACIPNLALYRPIKKWAAVAAILIAFCYMILAGATVPTVRAFIMTSLVLLAVILDRSAMNMRLVAFAALFVMVTTPEAVVGPSFVLSFAAVAALITFYRDFGRKWLVSANAYHPLYRPVYYLFGIALTSVVATLATAPFSVMFFNRFAVYGVLSNIVAMPLMAFLVMPFGLLACLFIPLGLDGHFWVMMQWGIDYIIIIAHAVEALPYSNIAVPSFGSRDTILVLVGFIILILWRGVFRWIGLPLIVIAFLSTVLPTPQQVMISEDMKAILIVDKKVDNHYLIGTMNGYLRSNWLSFHGVDDDVYIPSYKNGNKIDSSMGQCDDFECRLTINGNRVTILFHPSKQDKACQNSDILIASWPVHDTFCDTKTIIDRFDVWRHGAMTIDFDKNGEYLITKVK